MSDKWTSMTISTRRQGIDGKKDTNKGDFFRF